MQVVMPMKTDKIETAVATPIYESFRTAQVCGMFGVELQDKATQTFSVDRPPIDEDWSIGLIVGPSGSGKSTIARHLFADNLFQGFDWSNERAVVDNFGDHPIKTLTGMLTRVGFSSPPSWLKPYSVLSNGEKFRCDLAKAFLDSPGDLVVFDEFTSVVDRNVAKIGSAAIAKAIKNKTINKKFVAVSCHYDIIDWLEPDWVLDMATGEVVRRLHRRPEIKLQVVKANRDLWSVFARHHYLNGNLHNIASCYCALWNGEPVAFCALLPLMGHKGRLRVSRIVTLPDYQGVGIGSAFLEAVGTIVKNSGKRLNITTSHPAIISHCNRSPKWKTVSVRKNGSMDYQFRKRYCGSAGRAVVSFEFLGKIEE